MKHYETIVIMDPDLAEENRTQLLDRFEEITTQMGGAIIQMDHWGMKKLAYEIKKKPRGYYLRMDYGGEGSVVDEIERFCRIDDRVLKYMTVLQAETVDVAKRKAELAEAEAKKAPIPAQETPVAEEATPAAEKETPVEEEPAPVAEEATPAAEAESPIVSHEASAEEPAAPEASPAEPVEGEATQTETDETKREESE